VKDHTAEIGRLKGLLRNAHTRLVEKQWSIRNLNRFCQDCAQSANRWEDQLAHHEGCSLISFLRDIEEACS
jgi:hypothetical protein